MPESVARLRGGSWDGRSTVVAKGVRELLTASAAPGMLEVYQQTGETTRLPDGTAATVYEFTDQRPIGELSPELLHMPPTGE